jgi:cob(I)alamin adenosyltransferase
MMTIYTRTGDLGQSDLLGSVRVPKDAAVLEVCGDLDELNAWLGLARCEPLPTATATLLEQLQHRLFQLGAELVAVASGQTAPTAVGPPDVAALEQTIDRYEAALPSAGTFVLPAGSRTAAVLHVARAVCRRTERRLVSLLRAQPQAASSSLLSYINRLSDLLHVLARAANAQAGIADTQC